MRAAGSGGTKLQPKTLSLTGATRGIALYRRLILRRLLRDAGFRDIMGHWIYAAGIEPGAVVIDLGANQGAFSRAMVTLFQAKCYAVEANEQLFRDIDDEGLTKLNVAVAPTDGPVAFYTSSNSETGTTIPDFQDRWATTGAVVVRGMSWSALLRHVGLVNCTIDLVKMDIEGSELDLIESFEGHDVVKVRQITVEFHDWLNKSLHDRTVGVIRKLCSMGFVAITDVPDHSWPVEVLFLNKALIDLTPARRVRLKVFEALRFLNY